MVENLIPSYFKLEKLICTKFSICFNFELRFLHIVLVAPTVTFMPFGHQLCCLDIDFEMFFAILAFSISVDKSKNFDTNYFVCSVNIPL